MAEEVMGEVADYVNGEPEPIPNDGPSMHDLVIADMEKRKQLGLDKYGTLLQTFNGRNALKDAYEELLDLLVYLRQHLEEQAIQSPESADSGATNPTRAVGALEEARAMIEMPVFILKAKDRYAIHAIRQYMIALLKADLDEQAREVHKAMTEFDCWMLDNPSLVKNPDHRHVPVVKRPKDVTTFPRQRRSYET